MNRECDESTRRPVVLEPPGLFFLSFRDAKTNKKVLLQKIVPSTQKQASVGAVKLSSSASRLALLEGL